MEKLLKSGKICSEVIEFARTKAKHGIKLIDLANQIDEKIYSLGAKPAFPVNLSLNHIAAHFTPNKEDTTIFEKDDILKVDIGIHIDGYISDSAITLGNNKELIKASEEALKEAIKVIHPGIEINQIGKKIHDVITSYNFTPILNLSGHEIQRYNLHAGLTIPNYNNENKTRLEENQVIAIEPFATTGKGKVIEGKPSSIYRLVQPKPVRDSATKNILIYIEKEYSTMPFCKRWLQNKFPTASFSLKILEQQGIIEEYAQLPEETKGLVSQAEHTIIVKEKPVITTKKD